MSEFQQFVEELTSDLNEMVEAIVDNKLVILMINGNEEDYHEYR